VHWLIFQLSSGKDDHTMHLLKSVEGPTLRQVPADVIVSPPLPVPEACATPMPDRAESGDLSPAWQPSARLVHWLEDEHLAGIRLKLFQKDDLSNVLEFKEVVGDDAKIRDGFETKLIPLNDLHPVRPMDKGQLVTATSGVMCGAVLKVGRPVALLADLAKSFVKMSRILLSIFLNSLRSTHHFAEQLVIII